MNKTPTLESLVGPVDLESELARVQSLVGVSLRRDVVKTAATEYTMLSFCRGIGSRNPLFLDRGHAAESPWGTLVAHPLYPITVDDTYVVPGFAGWAATYGEVDWTFERPIRAGDGIRSDARLLGNDVIDTRFAGTTVRQLAEVRYTDGAGRSLATALTTALRYRRGDSLQRGLFAARTKYQYSPGEMEKISSSYDDEAISGAQPRYWEDVTVGEVLGELVKGPLTSEDMLHFLRCVRPTRVFADSMTHMRKHPGAFFMDADFGMPDSWEEVWFKDAAAQSSGYPAAHETGLQRVAWIGDLIGNWASDQGFLRRLKVRLTQPCIYADTTWCAGKVVEKVRRGSAFVVLLDVICRDQRGEITATGTAEVWLPSRDPAFLPVPATLGEHRGA